MLPGCRYLANKYQDKAGHLLGVGTKERALVDNWLEVGLAHSSTQTLSARVKQYRSRHSRSESHPHKLVHSRLNPPSVLVS